MHFAYCALSNTSLAGGDGPHEAVVEADEPLLEVERPLVPEPQLRNHLGRLKFLHSNKLTLISSLRLKNSLV